MMMKQWKKSWSLFACGFVKKKITECQPKVNTTKVDTLTRFLFIQYWANVYTTRYTGSVVFATVIVREFLRNITTYISLYSIFGEFVPFRNALC